MNSTLKSVLASSPVSQAKESQQLISEIELWEPPFERWMRLADSMLGKVPGLPRQAHPVPQSLNPVSR
ncbi:MAG TPA: hypothetical protein VFA85_12630 [Terriglobales bacterium]|nr:hypothetical protein [Terriglobales bacterium]